MLGAANDDEKNNQNNTQCNGHELRRLESHPKHGFLFHLAALLSFVSVCLVGLVPRPLVVLLPTDIERLGLAQIGHGILLQEQHTFSSVHILYVS